MLTSIIYGQSDENCFLDDFELKTAVIPNAVDAVNLLNPQQLQLKLMATLLEKFPNMYLVTQLQPGPVLMMILYLYKELNFCRRLSFVSRVEAGQMDIFGMEYQPMFRIPFMMVPHTTRQLELQIKANFMGNRE